MGNSTRRSGEIADHVLYEMSWDAARGPIRADVPVTLLWGDHDRVLWPWQADRAVRLLPGGRLAPLAGCGHVPTFDDPEQVSRLMLEATGAAGR
jgi:pimeloyl-ACP methyl ester carboxylesterase